MAKRKSVFVFETKLTHAGGGGDGETVAKIYENKKTKEVGVHMAVCNKNNTLADVYLDGKYIELFALNILKALKSKHLKDGK